MSIKHHLPERVATDTALLADSDKRISELTAQLDDAKKVRKLHAEQAIFSIYGIRKGSVVQAHDKVFKVENIGTEYWSPSRARIPSMNGYARLKSKDWGTRLLSVWAWSDNLIKMLEP